jgi:hypothetical protein
MCSPAGYAPRQTAQSDLCRIVREHLPSFIELLERDGGSLPGFVVAELEGLLRCGDFRHGFLRLCCTRCGDELRVPFSCKGRGVCPSCIGRRMCETASNWVDHLLPSVPYRQWVLSFDSSLAVRLGYDRQALDLVCRSFARRVTQTIRWLCKRQHGMASVACLHPGMLTVVQRFRSDCGLFVHLHGLTSDGAFAEQPGGTVRFHALSELREEHLVGVLEQVATDLTKAGLPDELDIEASLAACVQLALSTPTASNTTTPEPSLNVFVHGMNLHAATTVDGRDRKRLERVCKYLLRPPFALDAVHLLPDGRVRLELGRKGRAVHMTPNQFLAKLAALVPPPLFNMTRYSGCFANRHHLRPLIVPRSEPAASTPVQLPLFDFAGRPLSNRGDAAPTPASNHMQPRSWSALLARVFSIDITACSRPGCDGRLKIVDVVVDPEQIALLLHGARAPPLPPPRGQLSLLPS